MSECSLSRRGQGHMSNFYIVDLENDDKWYLQLDRGRFVYDTHKTMKSESVSSWLNAHVCLLHIASN